MDKYSGNQPRALFELILGILDTFQTVTKSDLRRAKERELRRRSIT